MSGTKRGVRLRSRGTALATALAALAAGAGCSKGFSDGGPDIDYLLPAKAGAEGPDGKPLPKVKDADAVPLRLLPGRTWSFVGVRGAATPGAGSGGAGGTTFTSEITVERAGPGAPAGAVLLVSRRGGKVFRTEMLREEPDGGLSLLALGESAREMITLSPPVPLYRRPYAAGATQAWSGAALMRKREFAAHALTRLTAVEAVEGPAGTFPAYRMEHVLALTVGGRQVQYPLAVWLAPGVGIVRRRLADRGATANEELRKLPPTLPAAAAVR